MHKRHFVYANGTRISNTPHQFCSLQNQINLLKIYVFKKIGLTNSKSIPKSRYIVNTAYNDCFCLLNAKAADKLKALTLTCLYIFKKNLVYKLQ